jgi:hypothetical protein
VQIPWAAGLQTPAAFLFPGSPPGRRAFLGLLPGLSLVDIILDDRSRDLTHRFAPRRRKHAESRMGSRIEGQADELIFTARHDWFSQQLIFVLSLIRPTNLYQNKVTTSWQEKKSRNFLRNGHK